MDKPSRRPSRHRARLPRGESHSAWHQRLEAQEYRANTEMLSCDPDMDGAAPLWGVRLRPRLMHDGASLTVHDAILRHRGEARQVIERLRVG